MFYLNLSLNKDHVDLYYKKRNAVILLYKLYFLLEVLKYSTSLHR